VKNGVCRFWGVLSHIVEEEFGLFLGIDGNASYLCNRIKKQASFKIVFFHIELLVLDHTWFLVLVTVLVNWLVNND